MSAWSNLAWAPGAWAPGAWQPTSEPPPTPTGFLPPVYTALATSAQIRAIVGSNPSRIYRHGRAPQHVGKPYITWFLVSGVPELNLSDSPPADRMTVQIDCWHPEDEGVEQLAKLVRDRIELFAHVTTLVINEYEADPRLYRIALQADWFWGRP